MVKFKIIKIIAILISIITLVWITPVKVSAQTFAYVNWKQYDARWGKILIGDADDTTLANIGCASTSTAVLLAHSGVCSSDEEIFNPAVYIPELKAVGAFDWAGGIAWKRFLYYTRILNL